jgi:hypothetical protein
MKKLFFAFFILALTSCSNDEKITTGSIIGEVLTTTGDTVISGARINTEPATDTVYSDVNGKFTLSGLLPGSYYVIAHKAGYSDGNVPVVVLANSTSGTVFKLSRVPVNLTGQWQGRIAYDAADYPLLFDFIKVTADSIKGSMVVDFATGSEIFPVNSKLFFNNDSLHFNLSHTFGDCYAFDIWGRVITEDSLSGSWRYKCNGQDEMIKAWSAKRKVK